MFKLTYIQLLLLLSLFIKSERQKIRHVFNHLNKNWIKKHLTDHVCQIRKVFRVNYPKSEKASLCSRRSCSPMSPSSGIYAVKQPASNVPKYPRRPHIPPNTPNVAKYPRMFPNTYRWIKMPQLSPVNPRCPQIPQTSPNTPDDSIHFRMSSNTPDISH